MKLKKWHKIAVAVLVVLIVFRIYLPYWVTDYVNEVLNDVPGYRGSIEDVDINLYRGAYKIRKLRMEKIEGDIPVPFVDIDVIDLSVEWRALFKGKIVGEIVLVEPVLNFVASSGDDGMVQTGTEADWTKPLKELMPLKINRLEVRDGTITFRDYGSKPPVNISLDDMQAEAKNLTNIERKDEKLPSLIHARATSIGGGKLHAACKANMLKKIPDFDLDFKFEDISLPALNDIAQAYARLDFEKGNISVYSEMAVSDGKLEGYVKPIMTDLRVVDLKNEKDKPLQLAWEITAGGLMHIFENIPKDQFATKAPMRGDFNKPHTSIWPALGNIFKNAFIKALTKDTDNTISYDDVKEKDE